MITEITIALLQSIITWASSVYFHLFGVPFISVVASGLCAVGEMHVDLLN